MPNGFVVAQLDDAGKPVGYFKNFEFVPTLSDADFFENKNRARGYMGQSITSFPENEYVVLAATQTIVLS